MTSCIHNILSGQRWIEHYGEVLIRNTQDSSCHCKITFCKVGAPSLPVRPQRLTPGGGGAPLSALPPPPPQAKYWSSNIHEVQGAVFSRSGRVLHRLSGKWHEGLYRGTLPSGQCIWKPSKWGGRGGLGRGEGGSGTVHLPQPPAFPPDSMPPDHERNFGFTQFALELNELTAELKRSLPSTDTRLRPDQRSVSGRPHPRTAGLLRPRRGFPRRAGPVLPSWSCLREMGPGRGQSWAGDRGLGSGGQFH